MRIANFSVDRPVTIVMIVIALLILGAVCLGHLSVDSLPDIENPVITINASYPGAGPEEVEYEVSRVLESGLATLSGVDKITTTCDVGNANIILGFGWGTNMDAALADVRAKIDQVKKQLPDDVQDIIAYKTDTNAMPIMAIGVSGDQELPALTDLIDSDIQPVLERIDGVAAVTVRGGARREIQVRIDPWRLQSYGLNVSQVTQVLQGENIDMSGGLIPKSRLNYIVRALGKYQNAGDIAALPVLLTNGGHIYLRDVAEVEDTFARRDSYALLDGLPALALNIQKESGANTVEVAQRVKEKMVAMQRELPGNIQFKVVMDQSVTISRAINRMKEDTVIGSVLAMAVLLIFLRNVRTTLVITIAIPFAILAAFILFYFNDMTLNIMSLGGLALGAGHMVDYAIVVLESIFRYRQKGFDPGEAAKKGTAEVGLAVFASALTVAAVFLPMVFVQGLAGQIFKQFALAVAFSQMAALFVSLTLIPMLSSRILSGLENAKAGNSRWRRLFNISEVWYQKLEYIYGQILAFSLRRRILVVSASAVILIASLFFIPLIGSEFMPVEDSGYINIALDMPVGTKLEDTGAVMEKIGDKLKQFSEVDSVLLYVGGAKGQNGVAHEESGQMNVLLKSATERSRTTEAVTEDIRKQVKGAPSAKLSVSIFNSMSRLTKSFSGRPIEIALHGDDLQQLQKLSQQITGIVKNVVGTRQVMNNMEAGRPELQLRLDRERLSQYGLTAAQVSQLIKIAGDGQVATTMEDSGDSVDVRLILNKTARADTKALENLFVTGTGGIQVPLTQVAEFVDTVGPSSIQRDGQSRVAYIYGDFSGRDLGSITKEIQAKVNEMEIPPGYTVKFGGQQEDMAKSFNSLGIALILALLLVYMVMASQFESLLYPFVIMFSIPLSITGVVLSLFLTGRSFSVPAYIGIIMMCGIVVNNAIVLVDYVNTLKKQGLSRDEAILTAGPVRLRPILMTALCTVFGLIPLALGLGQGSETQAPMATVVIGGLLVSTFLTLIIIPVVYTLLDDAGQKLVGKLRGRKKVVAEIDKAN